MRSLKRSPIVNKVRVKGKSKEVLGAAHAGVMDTRGS